LSTVASNIVKVGLIGAGIQSSRSPAIHRDEAAALGLPLTYELFDLDHQNDGAGALAQLLAHKQQAGYAGVNVTHPCKQSVIQHLDELTDTARLLNAVNTVVFSGGRRIGHNTDWQGFLSSFQRDLPTAIIDQVLLLGAGGAGMAVGYAMLLHGVKHLTVFDTDTSKAQKLCSILGQHFATQCVQAVATLPITLNHVHGVINSTPVGMQKYPGLPLPAAHLRPDMWVADVVYFPLETELLGTARTLGCATMDGGGMVVYQAAEAFKLFTGIKPDAERMMSRFQRL
jgi:shikimate dehydrogenase